MSRKKLYVYITSNKRRTMYYIGVRNNLQRRIREHAEKLYPKSFTAKHNIDKLIYCEQFDSAMAAIRREKQLKRWTKKRNLI